MTVHQNSLNHLVLCTTRKKRKKVNPGINFLKIKVNHKLAQLQPIRPISYVYVRLTHTYSLTHSHSHTQRNLSPDFKNTLL